MTIVEKQAALDNELCQKFADRERQTWTYECDAFVLKGRGGFGKFRIRPATALEQEKALMRANEYIKARAKESPGIEDDQDFVKTVRAVHILNLVCLDEKKNLPAFIRGPKWMLETFNVDELSVISSLYGRTMLLCSPLTMDLENDYIEGLANTLHKLDEAKLEETLTEVLSCFTIEIAREIMIRLSNKLAFARLESDQLREAIAKLEAERDALKGPDVLQA